MPPWIAPRTVWDIDMINLDRPHLFLDVLADERKK
jgi:hypothetical protein